MHWVLNAQSLHCGYRPKAQSRPVICENGDKVLDRRALGVGCIENFDAGPFEFREIGHAPWHVFPAPQKFGESAS